MNDRVLQRNISTEYSNAFSDIRNWALLAIIVLYRYLRISENEGPTEALPRKYHSFLGFGIKI